jgi:hypothetical protein
MINSEKETFKIYHHRGETYAYVHVSMETMKFMSGDVITCKGSVSR